VSANAFDPPAFVQSERVRGEPKCYWPALRPDDSGYAPSLFNVVPDEQEVVGRHAVEAQVMRFNAVVGLFAAIRGVP
jgi:hypothetical protein